MKRTAVFLAKSMLAIVLGLCCGTGAKALYRAAFPKQGVVEQIREDGFISRKSFTKRAPVKQVTVERIE